MNNKFVSRLPEESVLEYQNRLCSNKSIYGLTWKDIATLINNESDYNFSESYYRKHWNDCFHDFCMNNQVSLFDMGQVEDEQNTLDLIKLEKTKLADERTQINSIYRRISRENTLVDMAKAAAQIINCEPVSLNKHVIHKHTNKEKDAILEISDWHYGVEIDNFWNKYNPDIAEYRIAKLLSEVTDIVSKENITHINVVNLGDMIAGRIHLPLRLNSRFDVVTQILKVSELIAQFLISLSDVVDIDYYDTLDNHSRIEPNIKESWELESLSRFTTFFLQFRKGMPNNVVIHENTFSDDIIAFNCMGYNVAGVHGHKDKPAKVIDNMCMMTQQHYDIVLTAHLHHFSCDEKNECVLVSNSSMMGTDDFAEKLRLSAKPSQNMIIVTKDNPVNCIYKINLE